MYPYSANVGMRGVSPYSAGSRLRQQSMFGHPPITELFGIPLPNPIYYDYAPWYGQSGTPLPFSTGPQALSPQFDIGGILNQLPTIIETVNQLPGIIDQITSLWPFLAGPRMRAQALSPQFDIGGILNQLPTIIDTVSQLPGILDQITSLWPFLAGPRMRTQAVNPQFALPDISGLLSQLPGIINTINQVTSTLSQIADVLPFYAGPRVRTQAVSPQFLPDISGLLSQLPGIINTINQLPGILNQITNFLPFSAGPQLKTQGLLGAILGTIGAPVGGLIGNIAGNQDLGSTIGGIVGSLGSFLPFSAGPQLALAGAEPSGQTNGAGGPKPILLPRSAVPAAVRMNMDFESSLVLGGVREVVGNLVKAVSETTNLPEETMADTEAMASRALDLIEEKKYPEALLQAYIAYQTLTNAKTMQSKEVVNSQPVPVS